MAFSDEIVRQAWNRAGGKCECKRTGCGHPYQCNKYLFWGRRGTETEYGWETHHIVADGPDTLDNCEILCQRCHKNTGSYGG